MGPFRPLNYHLMTYLSLMEAGSVHFCNKNCESAGFRADRWRPSGTTRRGREFTLALQVFVHCAHSHRGLILDQVVIG